MSRKRAIELVSVVALLAALVVVLAGAFGVLYRRGLNMELATALQAESEAYDTAKSLVARGADVNTRAQNGATALMLAAEVGDVEWARDLLESGAEVNARHSDGRTPLMCATVSGEKAADMERLLLRSGADVNAKDKRGYTALMWAVHHNGRASGVQALLEAHPDLHARNAEGKTALAMAQASRNAAVVSLLRKAGARE